MRGLGQSSGFTLEFLNSGGLSRPQFKAEMQKYAPTLQLTTNTMRSWAGVQLVKVLLSKMNDADITRAGVLKALQTAPSLTFVWYKDLTWTKPGPVADEPKLIVTDGYAAKVANGAFVSVSDAPISAKG